MEEYESAKLRMQCLELAKAVALSSASGMYHSSIVSDAKKYWKFVEGTAEIDVVKKSDDEIPF